MIPALPGITDAGYNNFRSGHAAVESLEAAVPAAGYRFCAGDTPAATAQVMSF
jgi:hypothetical protein